MSALKVCCWPASKSPLSWHEPEVMLNPAHHPWAPKTTSPIQSFGSFMSHSHMERVFRVVTICIFLSLHQPVTPLAGALSPSSTFLLVPLHSSHHPLQETRRPRNQGGFYHPVLLKVMLNHGVPAGVYLCSCVMLRAPCRQGGLAVACLENAPVGVLLGNYWPGNGLPAPACLISCLS